MAATQITLSIDSTLIANAIAALNWKAGYQAKVTDTNTQSPTFMQQITNPVTPAVAAKQMVIQHVLSDIADYNAMVAQQAVVPPANNLIS